MFSFSQCCSISLLDMNLSNLLILPSGVTKVVCLLGNCKTPPTVKHSVRTAVAPTSDGAPISSADVDIVITLVASVV